MTRGCSCCCGPCSLPESVPAQALELAGDVSEDVKVESISPRQSQQAIGRDEALGPLIKAAVATSFHTPTGL